MSEAKQVNHTALIESENSDSILSDNLARVARAHSVNVVLVGGAGRGLSHAVNNRDLMAVDINLHMPSLPSFANDIQVTSEHINPKTKQPYGHYRMFAPKKRWQR